MRRPSLHGAGEFVSATWEMINGGFVDCGWSADGTEIVVYNPERLAENVLPRFFRHTQYSSWVRTLNHYSFRKTRPGQWINPNFQRGKPELLHIITRKVRENHPSPLPSCPVRSWCTARHFSSWPPCPSPSAARHSRPRSQLISNVSVVVPSSPRLRPCGRS